jgi:hypothetical protein
MVHRETLVATVGLAVMLLPWPIQWAIPTTPRMRPVVPEVMAGMAAMELFQVLTEARVATEVLEGMRLRPQAVT